MVEGERVEDGGCVLLPGLIFLSDPRRDFFVVQPSLLSVILSLLSCPGPLCFGIETPNYQIKCISRNTHPG